MQKTQTAGAHRVLEAFSAGVFLVDKPPGPSSFAVVQRLRKILGMKKVGHAGTLDPFASGLLIVCAGRPATRIISQIMPGEKEYAATLRLGIETDTFDPEGRVTSRNPVDRLTAEDINRCLERFRGENMQVCPAYSALKHNGKPLYYYARKGIDVPRKVRPVTIRTLECTAFDENSLEIRVSCSKGTYIRTLASDIGKKLGCGAHLSALRRLRSGFFHVDDAVASDLLFGQDLDPAPLLERVHTVEAVLNMLDIG